MNMKWDFYEFENDKKQHINLSESAWCVVEQDIKNFYLDEEAESKSGFFNKIITNFHDDADASINNRYNSKVEELEDLLKGLKNADNSIKEQMISIITENYKKKLIDKSRSYPKGHGEKFRINVDNVELFKNDYTNADYYDGTVGQYLKALFEEYCQLPMFQRELVFFRDIVDEIEKGINTQKKIKITIKKKFNPDENNYYYRKFYISPYKIVQDSTKAYNYIVGISEEIFDDNTTGEKQIASFRISRIEKIMVCRSMSGFLSQEKKDKIESELKGKTPAFMTGDIIDIKVRFTKKGLEQYNRFLNLRPNNYSKVENECLTYIFHCTEFQASTYFLKFMKEIEIMEPLYLREKFMSNYKEALAVYEEVK